MHYLACSANGRQADKHKLALLSLQSGKTEFLILAKKVKSTSKFGSFLGNCHSRKKGSVYDNEMTPLFDHTLGPWL